MSGAIEVGPVAIGRLEGRLRASWFTRGASVLATIADVVAAGSRGAGPQPAAGAENVAIGQGTLRVDRVGDEEATSMRRMGVDISLIGPGTNGGRVSRDDFRVAVEGRVPIAPVSSGLTRSVISAGTSPAGNLAFNVPSGARRLQPRVHGASRSIALGALQPSAHGAHHAR